MSLTLRPAVEADYPRILAIFNAQSSDPMSLEEYMRQDQVRPKSGHFLRLVALAGDETIRGYGTAFDGGGLMKPGHFSIGLRVDTPYRKGGTGSALLDALERFAREHGATQIDSSVEEKEPAALAWAEKRGYQKQHHIFKSSLKLAGFDPTPFLGPLERAQAEGFRFAPLSAIGSDEATYRRLFELYDEAGSDVPGQEMVDQIPYEFFVKAVLEHPRFRPDALWLALDGEVMAALAHLTPQQDGSMYHQFTGVRRAYRGRGLATAVKMAALQWAMVSGIPALKTDNHSVNERMLAVNRKMGYLPEPGSFTLRKTLAQ